jgi:xanthine dehydrogenase YagT iron-sulfur-binding subunit
MNRDDRKPRKPHAISRRSFIKGAGAVAAAAGLVRVGTALADEKTLPAGVVEKLGPEAATIELNINGKPATLEVEPRVTLLSALREHLGLTGTKLVCDRGACGACTVHLDGQPVTSCMMLAIDARGHKVTTIEGLGTPANMHPVQNAFLETDAQQCGFCTPGMVMSVAAALERNPSATIEEIKHATAGNTCRCGTYPHVFTAALKASKPAPGKLARSTSATGDA